MNFKTKSGKELARRVRLMRWLGVVFYAYFVKIFSNILDIPY